MHLVGFLAVLRITFEWFWALWMEACATRHVPVLSDTLPAYVYILVFLKNESRFWKNVFSFFEKRDCENQYCECRTWKTSIRVRGISRACFSVLLHFSFIELWSFSKTISFFSRFWKNVFSFFLFWKTRSRLKNEIVNVCPESGSFFGRQHEVFQDFGHPRRRGVRGWWWRVTNFH